MIKQVFIYFWKMFSIDFPQSWMIHRCNAYFHRNQQGLIVKKIFSGPSFQTFSVMSSSIDTSGVCLAFGSSRWSFLAVETSIGYWISYSLVHYSISFNCVYYCNITLINKMQGLISTKYCNPQNLPKKFIEKFHWFIQLDE